MQVDDWQDRGRQTVRKTTTKLADGRELIYFDRDETAFRDEPDRRPLEPVANLSEVRRDPVTGDWITVAAHRQGRIYHPPTDQCPLCPSTADHLSEVPAADYDVVVFENRFPSLAADAAPAIDIAPETAPDTVPDAVPTAAHPAATAPAAPCARPARASAAARWSASPPTTTPPSPTSTSPRPAWCWTSGPTAPPH